MRLRPRRPLVVAVVTVLAGLAGSVAVSSPAMAAELCGSIYATKVINSGGSYSGTAGNDVVLIKSTNGMTYYDPVDGSDTICVNGSSPATIWTAGWAHTVYFGNRANNVFYGTEGPDNVTGGSGDDLIKGNGGDDRLDGGQGNDYIRGGDGNDQIDGDWGDDCLVGGNGYDTIVGSNGNDTLLLSKQERYSSTQCAPALWDTSQAAQDFLTYPGDADGGEAYPGNENDITLGSNGDDYIIDSAGNDYLRSYDGNDSLEGGPGSDYLNAGWGDDYLSDSYTDNSADNAYGGPGWDTFWLFSGGGDVCFADWGPETVSCSSGQG